jgi:hypothetical protein
MKRKKPWGSLAIVWVVCLAGCGTEINQDLLTALQSSVTSGVIVDTTKVRAFAGSEVRALSGTSVILDASGSVLAGVTSCAYLWTVEEKSVALEISIADASAFQTTLRVTNSPATGTVSVKLTIQCLDSSGNIFEGTANKSIVFVSLTGL